MTDPWHFNAETMHRITSSSLPQQSLSVGLAMSLLMSNNLLYQYSSSECFPPMHLGTGENKQVCKYPLLPVVHILSLWIQTTAEETTQTLYSASLSCYSYIQIGYFSATFNSRARSTNIPGQPPTNSICSPLEKSQVNYPAKCIVLWIVRPREVCKEI